MQKDALWMMYSLLILLNLLITILQTDASIQKQATDFVYTCASSRNGTLPREASLKLQLPKTCQQCEGQGSGAGIG